MTLQSELVNTLKATGLSPDTRKPFHPHLPLGRARSSRGGRDLTDFIRGHSSQPLGQLDIRETLLIQSRLQPQGPLYTSSTRVA